MLLNFQPSKKDILSRVDAAVIMEWATGVQITKRRFPSPLRKSNSPTCGYSKTRAGKIVLVDYKEGRSYDCFDVITVTHNTDFRGALRIAWKQFIDNSDVKQRFYNNDIIAELTGTAAEIRIVRKEWDGVEIGFWLGFGITLSTLKLFHVYPLQGFYLNGRYYDVSEKLAFAYRLGYGQYQLYFPMNQRGKKFLTNHGEAILGYHVAEDIDHEFLFNQKSLKDIMVLYEMGYYAVGPIGESNSLTEVFDTIDGMAPLIVNWYDFDYAGIKATNRLRRERGWGHVFLTNGKYGTTDYGAKDISDFVKIHGLEAGKNVVEHLLMLYAEQYYTN